MGDLQIGSQSEVMGTGTFDDPIDLTGEEAIPPANVTVITDSVTPAPAPFARARARAGRPCASHCGRARANGRIESNRDIYRTSAWPHLAPNSSPRYMTDLVEVVEVD